LYPINELLKKGNYPDLFNTDIDHIISTETWIAYRSFLNGKLKWLENQSSKNEIAIQATILADKDTLGNVTLNFPLGILKETAREMVKKENEKPSPVSDSKLPILLTRRETADLLRVSLQTLFAWTRDGKIKAERLGKKQIRYRKENVEKFIQEIRTIKFNNY
jgi:excisionase family DNA binding protein